MHDFFWFGVCVFFLFGGFIIGIALDRVMCERSLTKRPLILTIPYFTNCQSVEVLSACSPVRRYRTNEKSIWYFDNCNIAKD